jgi:diguanylate cyclase (GGDEF)-like protein
MIVEASRSLNISIEDLTQDQFQGYVEQNSKERRKSLQLAGPEEIQEFDWEKAKELAIIIDSASMQIAEKYRFNIDTSPVASLEQNWELEQVITVNSKRRVFELSILTTSLCIFLSVGILFLISLLSTSMTVERGIIPAIAIPLIIGPIVSYIIFMQSYQVTQAIAKLQDLSRTDPLTGLYNKTFFTELVGMELDVASRYQFSSSLLLIDLDHFKRINDNYGHLAGDEVIRIISNVIRRNVRQTDVIGRFGADEIMIFLPHTDLEGAMVAADRVRRMISESEIYYKEERFKVTASIGAAFTECGMENLEQLLQAANVAMCTAKDKGRNGLEYIPTAPQDSELDVEVLELQSG